MNRRSYNTVTHEGGFRVGGAMNRRTVLQGAGTAAAVALPGCSMLGGCGPGEDSVEALEERLEAATSTSEEEQTAEEVRVKGNVQDAAEDEVIIDDSTGRASLLALGGFYMQNIGGGECVWATGFATEPGEDTDADVTILITDVGLEE